MALHISLVGRKNLSGEILVGYGAIATADIQEGLRRLRECFDD